MFGTVLRYRSSMCTRTACGSPLRVLWERAKRNTWSFMKRRFRRAHFPSRHPSVLQQLTPAAHDDAVTPIQRPQAAQQMLILAMVQRVREFIQPSHADSLRPATPMKTPTPLLRAAPLTINHTDSHTRLTITRPKSPAPSPQPASSSSTHPA